MPDNDIHKGEFIVRIVLLCLKSQNSGLKIEGSLNSEYWVSILRYKIKSCIIVHCHLV